VFDTSTIVAARSGVRGPATRRIRRISTARAGRVLAMIGTAAAPTRRQDRTEADMTTPPTEPDSGTPADRAAGAMDEDEYLGRDGGADSGAGSGAGADDPTTEAEEDSRFA
jgi:hypothetical protein